MCTGGSCFVTDKGRDLKKARASRALEVLAEAVGFEPTVPFGTTVFKTASLSHSDTPPHHRAVAAVRRTRRTGYHIPLRLWGIACFAALRGGCLRGTAYNSLHERTSHTRRATGAGRAVYGAGLGRGAGCGRGGGGAHRGCRGVRAHRPRHATTVGRTARHRSGPQSPRGRPPRPLSRRSNSLFSYASLSFCKNYPHTLFSL